MSAHQQQGEKLQESQIYLERIFQTTPVANLLGKSNFFYIYDLRAESQTYDSHQLAKMLGYALNEITPIGTQVLSCLLHPEDVDSFNSNRHSLFDSKDSDIWEISYRLRHKNGEWRWFRSQETVFVRDSEGLPVKIIGLAQDITEHKQLEIALKESQQRLKTIFNQTFQITGLLKTDGIFIEANQRLLDLTGQKHSEVVGRYFWDANWWQIYPETQHNQQIALTKQLVNSIAAAARGEWVRYEIDLKSASGTIISIDFSLKPVRDETGKAVLLIFEGREISDTLGCSLSLGVDNSNSNKIGLSKNKLHNIGIEPCLAIGIAPSLVKASRQQVKALLTGQNHILRMIAKGAPLSDVLNTLAQWMETQLPQIRSSFLLLDKNGINLRYGAAPSLPASYIQTLDGSTVGPFAGSEGTAAYWRESVLVEDTAIHPLWRDYRDLALAHGLKACWSVPILASEKFRGVQALPSKVLGVLTVYLSESRIPNLHEQELTDKATQLARIAIERSCAQEELLRSNAMLKAQQETAIDGILVIDENRLVASYNQRFRQLWQIPDQLLQYGDEGSLFEWLLCQLKYPPEFLVELEYLHSHPTETGYDEFILKDGRIFEFYSAPVLSRSGDYYGRIWYNRDITGRKLSEAVLRQTEEKYRKLVESAGDAIIAVDAQMGKILEANQMAEKILGRTRSKIIGKHHQEIYPQGKQEQYTQMLKEHLEAGGVFQAELELLHQSGYVVPVEVSATVVEVQGKKIIQGIFRDIGDRKQTEKVLKQAKVAAEAANRAKSEFLTNMSHELRTPLNGILGYAQILKRETGLNSEQQNGLEIIQRCGEHLLTLLNDILDLSKIEAGKMELQLSTFHLPQFLEGIAEIFRLSAQQKNIAFNYQLLCAVPQRVMGDEKRLRQVLINLLGNAIKFTDTGAVNFKVGYVQDKVESGNNQESMFSTSFLPASSVQLPSEGTTGKLRFAVEDTGIGIEPEQLSQIFLPFHQIADSRAKAEGTGLGLAISQKLARLMGSELKVESSLGQGSIFWLDLDLTEVLESAEISEVEVSNIFSLKPKNYRVLVADDRWENRSLMFDLLSPLGFEVIEATDGQNCLNQALIIRPDVILFDMAMPVINGFEVIRKLRHSPTLKEAIIIAISAKTCDADEQLCLAAGCDGFISKPVQRQKLLEQLCTHLDWEWVDQQSELEIQESLLEQVKGMPNILKSSSQQPMTQDTSAVTHRLSHNQDENYYTVTQKHQMENVLRQLSLEKKVGGNTSKIYSQRYQPVTVFVAPPPEVLSPLHELAMMGDIKGIQEQAKLIAKLDEKFVPFAEQLLQLAKGFQEKQILEFVRKYVVTE
ncbi:MAG: PAS domain S-box protein [Symploca sp. SIO2B6]|nr:PAS domain S-box protein [Symploca sp. SIO2B6]